MDRAAQYVPVSASFAAVLSGDRSLVSRLTGIVWRFLASLHASADVLYRRGRATLAGLLHRIHADRFSDLHCRVLSRTARRLVPAVAAFAAAFLLPPNDVLRAVPLGDGRGARQVGRLARRGARSSGNSDRGGIGFGPCKVARALLPARRSQLQRNR